MNEAMPIEVHNAPEVTAPTFIRYEAHNYFENGAPSLFELNQVPQDEGKDGPKYKRFFIGRINRDNVEMHDAVLAAYGFQDRSAYDENVKLGYGGRELDTAGTSLTEPLSVTKEPENMADIVNLDDARKRRNRLSEFARKHKKGLVSAVAGLALVTGLHLAKGNDQPTIPRSSTIAAAAKPIAFSADGPASTTSSTEAPSTTTSTTEAAKTTPEQQALIDAINAGIPKIGLKAGQYTEVKDPNATLPGAIEANLFSFEHGAAAWNGIPRTVEGAKLVSENLLNAKGGFTVSDANIAKQNLEKFNLPDDLIAQLAAGNYSNVEFKVITLNGTSATYHGMSWNNNGTLGTPEDRVVSPLDSDAVALLSFRDINGKIVMVPFRVDCGGINIQAFSTVTVETPATPNVTTTTTKPATTTTTTSTQAPTTSTTAPKPTTTTTKPKPTTTTTKPKPSTTTTEKPKHDPGHPPGEVSTSVPADPKTPESPTTSTIKPPTTANTAPANTTVSTTAPQGGHTPSSNSD